MSASLKKPVIIFCAALLLCSCASEYTKNYSSSVEPLSKVTTPEPQLKPSPGELTDANAAAESPLAIGIHEAILLAMENNQSLIVERMNPEIQQTFEQEELAVFDPLISPEVSSRRPVGDRLSRAGFSTESQIMDTITGSFSLEKLF